MYLVCRAYLSCYLRQCSGQPDAHPRAECHGYSLLQRGGLPQSKLCPVLSSRCEIPVSYHNTLTTSESNLRMHVAR